MCSVPNTALHLTLFLLALRSRPEKSGELRGWLIKHLC